MQAKVLCGPEATQGNQGERGSLWSCPVSCSLPHHFQVTSSQNVWIKGSVSHTGLCPGTGQAWSLPGVFLCAVSPHCRSHPACQLVLPLRPVP